jgi:hypothetical protein
LTSGLISAMLAAADSALDRPMSDCPWMICRCRLDSSEGADAGGGQVHQRRRAEAAGPDAEDPGVAQALLAGHSDIRDDQMARVAADLVRGQLGGRLDQRRQAHDRLPGLGPTGFTRPFLLAAGGDPQPRHRGGPV